MDGSTMTTDNDYYTHERQDVLDYVTSSNGSVLDVGGGVGRNAAFLKEDGKADRAVVVDLVGDNALPEIDAAFGGSLEDPALLDEVAAAEGPFQTVLCLDVLEHLSDPWSVIKRLDGMLAPGGEIIASIPNVRNYQLVWPLVMKGTFELADAGIMDRTHLRWFVKETAVDLMTHTGLKLEAVHGHFGGPKKLMFNKLTLGLFRGFLEIQYYIRVRKAG